MRENVMEMVSLLNRVRKSKAIAKKNMKTVITIRRDVRKIANKVSIGRTLTTPSIDIDELKNVKANMFKVAVEEKGSIESIDEILDDKDPHGILNKFLMWIFKGYLLIYRQVLTSIVDTAFDIVHYVNLINFYLDRYC